ncbi:MAG: PaaI family thioesterase [Candidatus Hydrogenedentota bacterium]|nr:MAG: PaaI family thioesterase [Candidatus Hydrogenedentota bacterium]
MNEKRPEVDFDALRNHANRIPMYKLIGMEVVEVRAGYSRFRLPFRRELTQPFGVLHGGALAAVADSAVAIALWGLVGTDKTFTTIEMKINFIAAVASGEVIAEGNIVHCGRRTAIGDVTLKDQDERLVGKCLATYLILPAENGIARPPDWKQGR